MDNLEDRYKALQSAIEKTVNKKMISPVDFDKLSISIYEQTGEIISSMTLKRFGDILARKIYASHASAH